MTNADRVKLLFGPYRTPRFRPGRVVTDEVRDRDVVIVGVSDGRIPWPVGQPKGSRARSLIVFDALGNVPCTGIDSLNSRKEIGVRHTPTAKSGRRVQFNSRGGILPKVVGGGPNRVR